MWYILSSLQKNNKKNYFTSYYCRAKKKKIWANIKVLKWGTLLLLGKLCLIDYVYLQVAPNLPFESSSVRKTHKMMEIKMVKVILSRKMYSIFYLLVTCGFEDITTHQVCFFSQYYINIKIFHTLTFSLSFELVECTS